MGYSYSNLSQRQYFITGLKPNILTCTNTLGTIAQHKWNNRDIEFGLDPLVVFLLRLQQRIVRRVIDYPSHRLRLCEDIPRRGMVFSTLVTGTVLTIRREHVDIVASNKVLRKINDCLCERSFPMMVCCVLGDVTD